MPSRSTSCRCTASTPSCARTPRCAATAGGGVGGRQPTRPPDCRAGRWRRRPGWPGRTPCRTPICVCALDAAAAYPVTALALRLNPPSPTATRAAGARQRRELHLCHPQRPDAGGGRPAQQEHGVHWQRCRHPRGLDGPAGRGGARQLLQRRQQGHGWAGRPGEGGGGARAAQRLPTERAWCRRQRTVVRTCLRGRAGEAHRGSTQGTLQRRQRFRAPVASQAPPRRWAWRSGSSWRWKASSLRRWM